MVHAVAGDVTYRLRWTGNCDRQAFDEAVAQHDFWYHSYYFDNGFEVRGDYDIGRDVDTYGFPEDMSGLRVLDVGTGSGWFAFFFEQRGATVTTVDARGYTDFDVHGRVDYPDIADEKPAPDRVGSAGEPVYYSPVSRGFLIMRDLLGSRVRYVNARVYELRPDLFGGERFDLVFMGALLPHVRDPVGALMAGRRVCLDRLIATTVLTTEWNAVGRRLRRGRLGRLVSAGLRATGRAPLPRENPRRLMELWHREIPIDWWRPNVACFREWFLLAGFATADVSRSAPLTSDRFVGRDDAPMLPRNPTALLRVGDARV